MAVPVAAAPEPPEPAAATEGSLWQAPGLALRAQAPLVLGAFVLLLALALGAFVWELIMGESILAGTPLGYLSVERFRHGIRPSAAPGEVPLMAAQHGGSGV